MIIGGAVIRNGTIKCDLLVENKVPVLRQREILSEKDANTPCRRIYFAVQLMYVDEKNLISHHNTYWKLVQDVLKAAPSMLGLIEQISQHILAGRYYQALKLAGKLIDYEQEVMDRAQKSAGSL